MNDMHHKKIPENILAEALHLFDAGRQPEIIVRKFPEYRGELLEMFQMIGALKHHKEAVTPPKEVLEKIISRVTEETENRYSPREIFSRMTFIRSLISAFELRMPSVRIALSSVAVLLLVVIFAYNRPGDPTAPNTVHEADDARMLLERSTPESRGDAASGSEDASLPPMLMQKDALGTFTASQAPLAPPSGDVDDAVAAFENDFAREESFIDGGDAEVSSFMADDGADAFLNFYDEEY